MTREHRIRIMEDMNDNRFDLMEVAIILSTAVVLATATWGITR